MTEQEEIEQTLERQKMLLRVAGNMFTAISAYFETPIHKSPEALADLWHAADKYNTEIMRGLEMASAARKVQS